MCILAWIPFVEKKRKRNNWNMLSSDREKLHTWRDVCVCVSWRFQMDRKNADKIVHYECAVDQSRMNSWKERRTLSLQMSNKMNSLVWLRVCGRFHVEPKRDMWIFALDTFCYSIKIVTAFLFQFHYVYFITNETDEHFQRTDRNNDAEPKKNKQNNTEMLTIKSTAFASKLVW